MMHNDRLLLILQVAAVATLCTASASAHHSFAMFDTSKKLTIAGTVTAFEWTNPHAYIEVDVQDDSGAVKHWSVELGSPSILQKSGWKFNTLKYGDKVTLVVNPLKSGQPGGGFLERITLSDGRVLGNGPSRGPQQ
jgi:hypothetical protein